MVSMYIDLLVKQNCNDLATVGDGHEYCTRGRGKLRMPKERLKFLGKPTIKGITLCANCQIFATFNILSCMVTDLSKSVFLRFITKQ